MFGSQQKDPKAREKDFQEALKLKNEGNMAFKKKDLKLALKCYTRMFVHIGINSDGNVSDAMASSNSNGNNNRNAMPRELTKEDRLRLDAFNNIALIYSQKGDWDKVRDKCDRALKHDPNNKKALFRRGMALRKLNLFDLAAQDLRKADKLYPNDKAILRELKLLKKEEKKATKAYYDNFKKQFQRKQANDKKKKLERERKMQQDRVNKFNQSNADSGPGYRVFSSKDLFNKNKKPEDPMKYFTEQENLFLWDQPLNEVLINKGSNNE